METGELLCLVGIGTNPVWIGCCAGTSGLMGLLGLREGFFGEFVLNEEKRDPKIGNLDLVESC